MACLSRIVAIPQFGRPVVAIETLLKNLLRECCTLVQGQPGIRVVIPSTESGKLIPNATSFSDSVEMDNLRQFTASGPFPADF